jgi:prepilin-type processing-associated H-X9-DG protein
MRQLNTAWKMYSEDNQDTLIYNAANKTQGWVFGVESWIPHTDNTNVLAFVVTGLGKYAAKNTSIFHCPADTSAAPGELLRLRSVSMNACVGLRPDLGGNPSYSGVFQFIKMADFLRPSKTFVFLDEHPDSIDDGLCAILNSPGATTIWNDLPAAYHDGAGSFSFADGHVEFHKWLDPSTRKPIGKIDRLGLPFNTLPGSTNDITWVLQRMSQ